MPTLRTEYITRTLNGVEQTGTVVYDADLFPGNDNAALRDQINEGKFAITLADGTVIPALTTDYTGAVVKGPQSNPGFLNISGVNPNLATGSYTPQNQSNPGPTAGGETLLFQINSNRWSGSPLSGVAAIGWPYVFQLWSVNASAPEFARRGNTHTSGQSILTVQ